MKYRNTLNHNSGFTLIEVVISIAVFLVILGLGAPFTINLYLRYQVDSERGIILALLRQARAMSTAGEGAANHGVYISSSSFTLFEGPDYQNRNTLKDRQIDRSNAVSISGDNEIIFRYQSGIAAVKSLQIENSTKNNTIYVNTEGRIDWE